MNSKKLAWHRENGRLLHPKFTRLATIGDKREEETPRITTIEIIEEVQKSATLQNFKVKINLDNFIGLNKLLVELDNRIFPTYQKVDIYGLNTYYADVFVELSIPRAEENFTLTTKLFSNTNSFIDSKRIFVKVQNDGKVKETNEQVEEQIVYKNTKIDIEFFFKEYELAFQKISEVQKKSLIKIFNGVEKYYNNENKIIDLNQLAYIIATTKHETNNTFNPIEEAYYLNWKNRKKYFEDMYDPILGKNEKRRKMAKDNGNESGDGVKYFGRGYAQLTWKNNYKKMKDKFKIDLVNYPDLALDHEIATSILIYGAESGSFTGLKLSKYINSKSVDYYNARRVINDLDKAKKIETYAKKIEKCIKIK